MPAFKPPSFQERAELAAKARQAALDNLRAKPPIDEALVEEKRAARLAREEAQAKARAEKLAAREREKAARKSRAAESEAPEKIVAEPTEAEKKAARDARYAARKGRKGRK